MGSGTITRRTAKMMIGKLRKNEFSLEGETAQENKASVSVKSTPDMKASPALSTPTFTSVPPLSLDSSPSSNSSPTLASTSNPSPRQAWAEPETSKSSNRKSRNNKDYPTHASAYKLLDCVGKGTEGSVWRAMCIPFKTEVAVKIVDLEGLPHHALEEVRQQTYVMQLCNRHPNIVKYHTSFVHSHYLWVVMSYLAGGSCLDIMKYAFPYGLDENAIRVILKGVLKALVFFHDHGRIHRDIKAGNILVSDKGHVQLADFGVSACLEQQNQLRTTLCGTPCWMAPEVMLLALPKQQREALSIHGYNCAVDIWSLGITALELARGRPPFAELPTTKVFSMIVQNPAPTLATEGKHLPHAAMSPNTRKKFSKNFQDFVACCLQKDPAKRPSAAKLLKHKFFSKKGKRDYLVNTVLTQLPPLPERFNLHNQRAPTPPSTTEPETTQRDWEWIFPEPDPMQEAFEKAWMEKMLMRSARPLLYSTPSATSLVASSFMSSATSTTSGDSWINAEVGNVDFLNHLFHGEQH